MRMTLKAVAAALVLTLAGCGKALDTSSPSEVEEPASAAGDAYGEPEPASQAEDTTEAAFCDEVGRRVSRADCDLFDHLADQAAAGVAAFNAPDPMARGETHTLQLALSFAPPAAQPAEPPAPAAEASVDDTRTPAEVVGDLPGETVQFAPLVGRFMRADLRGVGFEVTPITPASQEVLPDSVTTWSWRVVAKEGGRRTLTLTTTVEGCTAENQCYPLRSTSRNYEVEVTVGWLGRLQDWLAGVPTWLQIASGILGALAGLVAAYFSLRSALRRRA